VKEGFGMDDLKNEIEILEKKRDNCTITEKEEKKLTYLIWKFTNQIEND
jgi:hypothetical protein